MSKYYKAEDVIRAIDDAFDSIPMEQTTEMLKSRRTIKSLPTIEVSDKADRPFEYLEGFEDGKASVEVSEDCIDRKKLIEQIYKDSEGNEGWYGDTWKFLDTIELAPSVLPKAKEGEWIIDPDGGFKCSNCRAEEDEFIYGTGMRYVNGEPEFCPNCGAKMKGASDD